MRPSEFILRFRSRRCTLTIDALERLTVGLLAEPLHLPDRSVHNMTITVYCASCGRKYSAPRTSVGKRYRCKTCGHVQRIVGPEGPPQEPSVYAVAPEPVLPSRRPPRAEAPRPSKSRADRWPAVLRFAVFEESQVQGIACGLLFLSAADLFMTFTLLRTSNAFFESNPLAQWFFARWNIAGMALFKFSIIGAVVVVSEFIERRRPGWGRFVLLIGCCGAAYAVYKGFNLYMGHGDRPPDVVD
jgi:DNA-directed RNA polymerase subunit RPC12/RpoP